MKNEHFNPNNLRALSGELIRQLADVEILDLVLPNEQNLKSPVSSKFKNRLEILLTSGDFKKLRLRNDSVHSGQFIMCIAPTQDSAFARVLIQLKHTDVDQKLGFAQEAIIFFDDKHEIIGRHCPTQELDQENAIRLKVNLARNGIMPEIDDGDKISYNFSVSLIARGEQKNIDLEILDFVSKVLKTALPYL